MLEHIWDREWHLPLYLCSKYIEQNSNLIPSKYLQIFLGIYTMSHHDIHRGMTEASQFLEILGSGNFPKVSFHLLKNRIRPVAVKSLKPPPSVGGVLSPETYTRTSLPQSMSPWHEASKDSIALRTYQSLESKSMIRTVSDVSDTCFYKHYLRMSPKNHNIMWPLHKWIGDLRVIETRCQGEGDRCDPTTCRRASGRSWLTYSIDCRPQWFHAHGRRNRQRRFHVQGRPPLTCM